MNPIQQIQYNNEFNQPALGMIRSQQFRPQKWCFEQKAWPQQKRTNHVTQITSKLQKYHFLKSSDLSKLNSLNNLTTQSIFFYLFLFYKIYLQKTKTLNSQTQNKGQN